MSVESPFLIKVRLETREGAFVTDVLMPTFKTIPDVVVWGDRVFVARQFGLHPVYRESFAWHAATDQPTEVNS